MTAEEWWFAIKVRRTSARRETGLADPFGAPFTYTLPDQVLREIEFVASTVSGQIALTEQVTNPATRDRYLVNSLIEESIRSSQLEGAATTRLVAKEMIRSGRPPRDKSERMIANNFAAMRHIGELRDEPLTPDLVCELHRIVTAGTLDDPDTAGRFQRPDEPRVGVYSGLDEPLYQPPDARLLPERVARLCDFANAPADAGPAYLPQVLRAITLHFMLGYEHPFLDGNGRTARALFYWSMLRHGYWLTEFLSISRILRGIAGRLRPRLPAHRDRRQRPDLLLPAPARRTARGDRRPHRLPGAQDARGPGAAGAARPGRRRPQPPPAGAAAARARAGGAQYTVESHRAAHGVVTETARQDLVARWPSSACYAAARSASGTSSGRSPTSASGWIHAKPGNVAAVTSVEKPVAKTVPTNASHHGDTVVDEYAWLADKEDPDTVAYLKAENDYTEAATAHLAKLRDTLFGEIKTRTKETDLSVPSRKGAYWYYTRTVEGQQYGIHCRVAAAPGEARPARHRRRHSAPRRGDPARR